MVVENGRPTGPPGFRVPKRTALLRFEGDYEGAWMRCRLSVEMGEFFSFQRVTERGAEATADELRAAFLKFGDDVLEQWNFEDEDGPIPATGEGVLRLPVDLCLLALQHWAAAVAEPPAPLAPPAVDGDTSAAVTTSMGSA